MRMVALALGALFFCASSAIAQQSFHFSPERIRADVTFLADDLLEGRFTGTRGYDIAARYVASRFEALGLKPANQGSYFQQVRFAEARREAGAPSYVAVDGVRFENGVDAAIYPNSLFPDQRVEAEAVFVGYGLDAPDQGFDDYAGLDVRGKIAVALWGFPKGAPSEIAAHLLNEKAAMAKARGAIGLLTLQTPVVERILPWERRRAFANEPDVKWLRADGRPNYPGPDLPVTGYLGPKGAERLFANAPVPLERLLAATEQEGAKPKGFPLRPRLTVERHSNVRQIVSPNVVAVLPGSDPRLADEYIVLSAHLDHIGRVTPENGDAIANGAMDNASGIATMLEAARAFVESGTRPRRSILFAALTAEEVGLLGAEYLAMHPVVDGKLVGVVNLDMPILTFDFQDVIAFGAEHSTIARTVQRAIAAEGLKVSPDPTPEAVSFVRTDHYPFVKEGIPAVSLDTGIAGPGKAKVEEFLARHYHRPSDDLSVGFDWNAAAKFARINYLVARELADSPQEPRWYAGDYFGEQFAKEAAKAPR